MSQLLTNVIVAVDSKGGIAKNGEIPWYVPNDLKQFKNITTNTSMSESASASPRALEPNRKADAT